MLYFDRHGGPSYTDTLNISKSIYDRIWENLPCSEFYEILVSCVLDKLYPRASGAIRNEHQRSS